MVFLAAASGAKRWAAAAVRAECVLSSARAALGPNAASNAATRVWLVSSRAAPTPPPYEQGQHDGKRRLYFYYVDAVNGFLFLDNAKHKNFTSCYKDKAFLHFFYSHVRPARPADPGWSTYGEHFHWVSPCGRELNWIRAEDTPIVFTELRETGVGEVLCYAGGTKEVPFDVNELEYDGELGRLYHPEPLLAPAKQLLSSPLTIKLAKSMTVTGDGVAVLERHGKSHRLCLRSHGSECT